MQTGFVEEVNAGDAMLGIAEERLIRDSVALPGPDRFGASLVVSALPQAMPGRVLDLGAGDGRIGIAAGHRGARNVVLVEIDRKLASTAAQNLRNVKLPGVVLNQDYFCDFDMTAFGKVSTVVSNPPQLPSIRRSLSRADDGGPDGLGHFARVIEVAGAVTDIGGTIFLHVLGFLPVWCGSRFARCIEDFLLRYGFDNIRRLSTSLGNVRPDGATMSEIEYIVDVYGSSAFRIEGREVAPAEMIRSVRGGAQLGVFRTVVGATKIHDGG